MFSESTDLLHLQIKIFLKGKDTIDKISQLRNQDYNFAIFLGSDSIKRRKKLTIFWVQNFNWQYHIQLDIKMIHYSLFSLTKDTRLIFPSRIATDCPEIPEIYWTILSLPRETGLKILMWKYPRIKPI